MPLLQVPISTAQLQLLLSTDCVELKNIDYCLAYLQILLYQIIQFLVREINDIIIGNEVEKLFPKN